MERGRGFERVRARAQNVVTSVGLVIELPYREGASPSGSRGAGVVAGQSRTGQDRTWQGTARQGRARRGKKLYYLGVHIDMLFRLQHDDSMRFKERMGLWPHYWRPPTPLHPAATHHAEVHRRVLPGNDGLRLILHAVREGGGKLTEPHPETECRMSGRPSRARGAGRAGTGPSKHR